jgi:hypothetical protein
MKYYKQKHPQRRWTRQRIIRIGLIACILISVIYTLFVIAVESSRPSLSTQTLQFTDNIVLTVEQIKDSQESSLNRTSILEIVEEQNKEFFWIWCSDELYEYEGGTRYTCLTPRIPLIEPPTYLNLVQVAHYYNCTDEWHWVYFSFSERQELQHINHVFLQMDFCANEWITNELISTYTP